jgi:hypothetical protein
MRKNTENGGERTEDLQVSLRQCMGDQIQTCPRYAKPQKGKLSICAYRDGYFSELADYTAPSSGNGSQKQAMALARSSDQHSSLALLAFSLLQPSSCLCSLLSHHRSFPTPS